MAVGFAQPYAETRPKGKVKAVPRPGSTKRIVDHLSDADLDIALTCALSRPDHLTPRLATAIEQALQERKALNLREFLGLLVR